MDFILGTYIWNTFVLLSTVLIICYSYCKWCFKYWERKGVPQIKPTFPFGSISNPVFAPKSFGQQFQHFYNISKAKRYKYCGIYTFIAPIFVPVDVELVRSILKTDFDHFVDRGSYFNETDDPLSAHLFTIEGTKWKNLRAKIMPTFTPLKMRTMFPILVECSGHLKEAVGLACENNCPIDVKDFCSRFTTNYIGSCAFGIDCNCFKDKVSDFMEYAKKVIVLEKSIIFKNFVAFASPKTARRLKLVLTPRRVANFYMKIIKETVNYRENHKVTRRDFMQLLIEIKNSVKDEKGVGIGLTFEELAAQAFVFFVAGYETSSSTMTFCLFELACNPDIQQKVRDEVQEVLNKYNGELTYDALAEMKYMGQVIDESLRMYPPSPVLSRKCVKPYKIPNTGVVLNKDTAVMIPILGIQRDPEYFPEPEKFDPDRFSDENKSKIASFTYLPFGDGPRVCIGLRFAILQVKAGLAVLLRNYKFSLNSKTKTPLIMDTSCFVLTVKGGIWLNTEKINN